MKTPDHSNTLFYLLAAGALLVTLAGGLTGIAKRSAAVPREDVLTHERILEVPKHEIRLAPGSEKALPLDMVHASVQGGIMSTSATPIHSERIPDRD
jgi:hypothetical protein